MAHLCSQYPIRTVWIHYCEKPFVFAKSLSSFALSKRSELLSGSLDGVPLESRRRVWTWDAEDGGGDDTTSHELIPFLQRKLQPIAWLYSQNKKFTNYLVYDPCAINGHYLSICINQLLQLQHLFQLFKHDIYDTQGNKRSLTVRTTRTKDGFHWYAQDGKAFQISPNHDDHIGYSLCLI